MVALNAPSMPALTSGMLYEVIGIMVSTIPLRQY